MGNEDAILSIINSKLTWASALALIVYLLHTGVKYYLDWRTSTAAAKEAAAAAGRLSGLTTAINRLTDTSSLIKDQMIRLTDNESRLRQVVHDMSLRVSGALDRDSSLHIVDKFFADFTRDVASIFTYSLENNGYAERPDFIRDRVKTQLAQSLESQRAALMVFNLSIDLKPFFAIRESETTERFVLVDELWTGVEPLYSVPRPLASRVEEMRLITLNLIKDMLNRARKTSA